MVIFLRVELAARGKAHSYLKDQRALEDYLIDQGLNDAVLVTGDGAERAGRDLRDIVDQARQITSGINGLHSRYNRSVVDQGAIGGIFNPALLQSAVQALCLCCLNNARLLWPCFPIAFDCLLHYLHYLYGLRFEFLQ